MQDCFRFFKQYTAWIQPVWRAMTQSVGMGRVQEMADEVVASLVDCFRYPDQDTAWHGGCLALAEVARRGLLLPHRVPELAPVMAKALQYDLRRGSHRWLPWHPAHSALKAVSHLL